MNGFVRRLALGLAVALISQSSFGAPKVRTSRVRRRPAGEAAATPASTGAALPRLILMRVGLLLSQESIPVQGAAERASMETQFQGLGVSGVYSFPFGRSRWSRLYAAELGAGVAKGKANGVEVNDEVKGQPFLSVGLAPGLTYITSPVSRVGLMLPLVIRQIKWKVGGSNGFDPDRDSSFSVGLAGVFETRFSIRSSLIISATYQHLWQSTTFGLSYQRRLR